MKLSEFERDLDKQPTTVDMKYAATIIYDSIDQESYGKLQLACVMEEFAELIEVIQQIQSGIEVPRQHLIEEIADVRLAMMYLTTILHIQPKKPEWFHIQDAEFQTQFTMTLSKAIQLVSKFVRGSKNIPRKTPRIYRQQLAETLGNITIFLNKYGMEHNLSQPQINQAMNVKLKRQEKRNQQGIKDTIN